MKISYSFGIIDLLHYGHINTLLKAKIDSDIHIFGLVSDEASIEWMGTIVSNYEERKSVLENIKCIDSIMYQKTLDPLENLKKIYKQYPKAEIILYHGDNWKIMPSEQYLKDIGGKIVFTKYYDKMTPENIVDKLQSRVNNERVVSSIISTKANTLLSIKSKLEKSYIEDIEIIKVSEFYNDKKEIFNRISSKFDGEKIVVRSSSSNEDSLDSSNAGHYDSVLNVISNNFDDVCKAVELVVESYKQDSLNAAFEQILVQKQTTNVKFSGVIFTRDIHENRPYYLINYDDSGTTDSVTSGVGGKTIWIAHDTNKILGIWEKLIIAVKEIENILLGMVLDIEFAITNDDKVVIFQVRPLAANYKYKYENNDDIIFALKNNEKQKYIGIINELENTNMMLSDMAFWNPSEIIGSNPRNLDYSLYREIITKRAWNDGLVDMGYTKVSKELMYKLGNKPYISLEYSFMSLMPSDLSTDIKYKLLKFYKDKLKLDTSAHDKIEFEIVISCFDFQTNKKLEELIKNGFSLYEITEIRKSLFKMTENVFINYFNILKNDLIDLRTLDSIKNEISRKLDFKENDIHSLIEYFKTLIISLKKYATPQFSRQARHAFIARSLCESLVIGGYFSSVDMEAFMLSIHTVASDFEIDFNLYTSGIISKDEFNNKYGHLRSGTYDIRTNRYRDIKFDVIDNKICDNKTGDKEKTIYTLDRNIIKSALEDIEFNLKPDDFVNILKSSIEQREYFKFEFTKSLSLALEILIKIGEILDIERDELSYLEISDILASEYYMPEDKLREFWMTIINQRKSIYEKKSKLVLPDIILNENDIDIVKISESRPNFITNKIELGQIVVLDENLDVDIENKIVVIEKADPGFDWIFAKNIKGLITKYGGVASHMSIRCAEFGIPAAIGCGDKIFNYVCNLKKIKLDCKNGKIIDCEISFS